MEKNTGKTECLNYILRQLENNEKTIAITSIGTDGENIDKVTGTHKPEIVLNENTLFVTSEKYYRERKLTSEIFDVSENKTATGRLIFANTKTTGKIILSGPSDTVSLKKCINKLLCKGADIVLVDGALSRLSIASPSITEAMILTTGAALAGSIQEIVKKTKFTCNLINIDTFSTTIASKLIEIDNGIWIIDSKQQLHNTNLKSTLLLEKHQDEILEIGNTIFVSGIITDKILNILQKHKNIKDITLIVKDFTKIFTTPETYNTYINKGGKIKTLLKTKLIAVCINPVSPQGYVLDSNKLQKSLYDAIKIPVYDLKNWFKIS